ncbi:DUF4255 domain-containing protein [Mucilaginibacter agri]|uniref:DUF4255 domain-containing protein n=1 Tax=Mucilaginibacter agri TaxID=2695265 RepID=A0A965ZKH3_9SPHI|nr:DUF4255 domain-containing protein [Mucilaginibacter agri]NCD71683.1 DUF4255 domain-containing protein [Mucilaginibacter agri]
MSTALRIASVTYVLKDLLNNGLINHDVTGAVGETITVTAWPPDKIKAEDEITQLNLFMYQATFNSGWQNVAQPSLNSKGDRITNPKLALDLHYLLTAYGTTELHTEILLGYGMQLMHENPVLGRDAIRTSLAPPTAVPGTGLTSALKLLSTSGLADQAEMIKISPEILSIEDISKLWAAFGTRYRPTAAYKATVVLIESSKSTKSALPVKGRNIYVSPFKIPVIEQVLSQAAINQPIVENQKILPGYILVLNGSNFSSEIVDVKIDGESLPVSSNLVVAETQITFKLPNGLNAGVHEMQIVHPALIGSPPAAHAGVSSAAEVFSLSPVITNTQVIGVTGAGDAPRSATVKFKINPPVSNGQSLILLMNQSDGTGHSYSFPLIKPDLLSPPEFIENIAIDISGVKSGNYLLRVMVDGAESQLNNNSAGQYVSPAVHIP